MTQDQAKKPKNPNENGILVLRSGADANRAGRQWEGTVLAKFAEDVIALNRQAGLLPPSTMSDGPSIRVASLEGLQRGLKIKKTDAAQDEAPEKTVSSQESGAEVVSLKKWLKE